MKNGRIKLKFSNQIDKETPKSLDSLFGRIPARCSDVEFRRRDGHKRR